MSHYFMLQLQARDEQYVVDSGSEHGWEVIIIIPFHRKQNPSFNKELRALPTASHSRAKSTPAIATLRQIVR